jgi:hypothetical protein
LKADCSESFDYVADAAEGISMLSQLHTDSSTNVEHNSETPTIVQLQRKSTAAVSFAEGLCLFGVKLGIQMTLLKIQSIFLLASVQ